MGGPILKEKTFFFVAYQGLTEVNGLGDEPNPILPLLTSDRSAATLGAQFCPAGHLNNRASQRLDTLPRLADCRLRATDRTSIPLRSRS